MIQSKSYNFLINFFRFFIIIFFLILFVNALSRKKRFLEKQYLNKNNEITSNGDGFDLFISREEMNRTLGVEAEMIYINNGVINLYSIKFPYRISSNISHVFFTWKTLVKNKKIKYKIKAVAEDLDILPVIYIPLEGTLPTKPQKFAIEYRCAGSRSGQFFLTLFFNISWPSETNFTSFSLKQEKVCATKDGRRALSGNNLLDINKYSSQWALTQRELIYFGVSLFSVIGLLSVLFTCFSYYSSNKITNNDLSHKVDASSVAHPFYTATMLKSAGTSSILFPFTTLTKVTTVLDDSSHQAFLSTHSYQSDDDNVCKPLTSTPYLTKILNSKLQVFDSTSLSINQPKIIFSRRSHAVDVKNSLVELNADRNLFITMPQAEIEGKYGKIVWANWRQTGIGFSGDIDDEEDDAKEDTALICKTLKPDANRKHFEEFLHEVLILHNVPAHPNLAQVVAAATYGNFNNPDSVKDFPLMCYRHSGFGILKKFLLTCRSINCAFNDILTSNLTKPSLQSFDIIQYDEKKRVNFGFHQNMLNSTLRTHDLISILTQILKAIQHLHKFGIIHKDIAARNCLISENFSQLSSIYDRFYVQLCDFALSKDFFPDEYYYEKSETIVKAVDIPGTSKDTEVIVEIAETSKDQLKPLRWMAPETVRSNVFNSASDVWSFGIFAWELFTCGKIPFCDIEIKNMEIAIASGARPIQPYNCPDEMYDIMQLCWNHDPLQRPNTEQLMRVLNEFSNQLRKFI